MHSKTKIVLIPSAKLIPLELQADFGPIPSAMIPIASRPALHYVADFYSKLDYKLVVAVHENATDVIQYCSSQRYGITAKIIEVGHTRTLGETILNSLKTFSLPPDELAINFADTALKNTQPRSGNIIYSAKTTDNYRWTVFEKNENNQIVSIIDKDTEKIQDGSSYYTFIGMFVVTNVVQFQIFLEEAVGKEAFELDPFYVALKNYFNNLSIDDKKFINVDQWYDFGHLDTYYESKKQFSSSCRSFNSIELDLQRGLLKKVSKNTEKFIREIKWYLKLPVQLQYIAPRVFNYDISFNSPSVTLEFYGYPTLNDLYLFGHLDLGAWNRVFDSLHRVVQDMTSYTYQSEASDELIEAMQDMYVNKTIDRINAYISDPQFFNLRKDGIIINGKRALGLDSILDVLEDVLERSGIYKQKHFTIIHGDLCLSNILYDQRNRIVRLVDPRGSFGKYSLYGDPHYDLCKLTHSLSGDYDFLVNDLFDLTIENKTILLQPHLNNHQKQIKKLYNTRLKNTYGNNEVLKIRLIESLLFLSMIPLHSDRPRSQIAFLVRGLGLFSEIIEELL
jgi:hypothetical protein